MTTPQDPRRHPLQDDEVELARVLRALPTGEPSSKVDAAILAAAADAVAAAESPTRPRRRVRAAWALPTWAIGTAAAAVLAIGIGSQLLPPLSTSDDASVSAEQAAPRPRSAEDRLDVELVEPKHEYPPTYPPPPPPPPAAPKPLVPPPVAAKQAQPIVESAAEPIAFPQEAAAPPAPQDAEAPKLDVREESQASETRLRKSPAELNRLDQERRAEVRLAEQQRAERADAARADTARDEAAAGARAASNAAELAVESAPAPAPAAAPAPATVSAPASSTAPAEGYVGALGGMESGDAAGAPVMAEVESGDDRRQREADADTSISGNDAMADAAAPPPLPGAIQPQQALPPVASDTALAPADWIVRIRARLQRGDREGAIASLKLLRAQHPTVAIPADLEALH